MLALHPSREAMLAYLDYPSGSDFAALTRMTGPRRKDVAELHYSMDDLHMWCVVHECVHAAYALGRRGTHPFEVFFDHEEEERIAYPTGEIASAVLKQLAKWGMDVAL